MGVIVFAVIFCAAWGGKVLIYDPDARYTKHSRKTLFRGELKDAEHH